MPWKLVIKITSALHKVFWEHIIRRKNLWWFKWDYSNFEGNLAFFTEKKNIVHFSLIFYSLVIISKLFQIHIYISTIWAFNALFGLFFFFLPYLFFLYMLPRLLKMLRWLANELRSEFILKKVSIFYFGVRDN